MRTLLIVAALLAGCVETPEEEARQLAEKRKSDIRHVELPWGVGDYEFNYATTRDGSPIVCRMLRYQTDRGGSVVPLWCASSPDGGKVTERAPGDLDASVGQ